MGRVFLLSLADRLESPHLLSAGNRLGPYEILAPIGAGGMGEVYRAKDPRLGREVAIKVLPSSFSADADRLRRFEQEARAAGILNHPNITAVYDIGSHEGAPYVVQELLEGETLRSLLAGGRLAPRKTIDYSLQITHGLAAAHEKGIVHRDLKPENVFVTKDGRVKILDFGLAKLTHTEEGSGVTNLPTATAGTEPGVVLGTLGYMSPEQVRGRPADARSDIFSFGAILYEMLSGKRAFHGDSAADTMSAILKEDPPDLSVTNQTISPGLERIVRHCLEKNPEQRFHSAHDLAFDLEALSGVSSQSLAAAAGPAGGRRVRLPALALAAAAVALLVVGSFAGSFVSSRNRRTEPLQWRRLTFRRGNVLSARFAPDGKTVVYGAAWEAAPGEIFTARTDSTESHPIGLSRADLLAVSSKGELAVLLKKTALYRPGGLGTLARMPLGGGTPREVLEDVLQADWAPNGEDLAIVRRSPSGKVQLEYPIGTVLYEGSGISSARVSPKGDVVAFVDRDTNDTGTVTTVDRRGKRTAVSGGWTRIQGLVWSPQGDEIIFAAGHSANDAAIHAVSLSGRERILLSNALGLWLHDGTSDGHLLVERAGSHSGMRCLARGEARERELAWLDGSAVEDISENGGVILFGEYGEARDPKGGVFLRKTDGSPAIRLGDGRGDGLSSDGRWALSWKAGPPAEIVLLPTGPGTPRKIPVEGVEPLGAFLLPNGKGFLVAALGKSEPVALSIVGPEGGKPRSVPTEGLVWDGYAAVSPDGERIVYGAKGGQLKIAPLTGGETRVVPGQPLEPGDIPIQWSADGNFLFIQSTGNVPARVDRLELATGRREPWNRLGPEDSTGVIRVNPVVVARDGQSYAYSYIRVVASDLYVLEGAR